MEEQRRELQRTQRRVPHTIEIVASPFGSSSWDALSRPRSSVGASKSALDFHMHFSFLPFARLSL